MAKARLTNLLLAVSIAAMAASLGWAQETQLAGIALNDTPEDLMSDRVYGPPHAMFTPGNGFSFVRAAPDAIGGVPGWARAVQMANLGGDQIQWIYNRDPWVVGVVFTGVGINARVTDIIVSQWRTFQPSKIAETREGIRLGDSFADVLETYGWPNRMQIITESGASAAPAPAAGAAAGAPPVGIRIGFGRREDDEEAAAPAPVGVPGPLPSVGVPGAAAPQPQGPAHTASAFAGPPGNMTFSQACLLSYPSVDFILYRMKVFRIHIYGTTGQAAPGAPVLAGAGPVLPPGMAPPAPTTPQADTTGGGFIRGFGRRDD